MYPQLQQQRNTADGNDPAGIGYRQGTRGELETNSRSLFRLIARRAREAI